jgi:hypothetical protein
MQALFTDHGEAEGTGPFTLDGTAKNTSLNAGRIREREHLWRALCE